jgi:putative transcriptional regulator
MLIAMPDIGDSRFERTVIYLCAHSDQGALGLVVNKTLDTITFPELLDQLEIEGESIVTGLIDDRPIHFGGPVETSRGFVLHSTDYVTSDSTLTVSSGIGLTATLGILRAIANGDGPQQSLLALGYASWGAGQLESEIQANGWLHAPCDPKLIFGADQDAKWERALGVLGIDLFSFSNQAGHA